MFIDSVVRKDAFSVTDIEVYKEALRRPGALTAALNYYRANVRRLMSRRKSTLMPGPCVRVVLMKPVLRETARVRVPTLFIFAEQDSAIIPQTVRGVGNYIDAPYRELRIADSGHWVQNEAAEEVNTALVEFLDAD